MICILKIMEQPAGRAGAGQKMKGIIIMAGVVGIGIQDFSKIIENHCFYVDKTSFIKQWWENQDEVTLITRPRRFGKTLTMSMAEHFFSIRFAGRSDLFEHLNIWKEEKYRRIQGTYPVIFLSFASIKDTCYKDAFTGICQILTDLYSDHQFLLESGSLSEKEKEYFLSVSDHMDERTGAAALNRLSGFLAKYYGKKVIILLDEYDTPMQEAYTGRYWNEMVSLVRRLFHLTFKSNPWLERALLTGITRISKESVFSDLNHLKVVTTTTEKYGTSFGFTEEEVFRALDEYGLSDQKQEVKNWYDGFTFGSHAHIYNPWSVSNYLDEKKYAAYWANTSSNGLAGRLILKGGVQMELIMENLLQGGDLVTTLDEEIVYNQLEKKKSAVWSLLLASGYLKIRHSEFCGRHSPEYTLAITNLEVRIMFEQLFTEWFSNFRFEYHDFSKALISGDLREMNAYMNSIAESVFSYFDTGGKPSEYRQPENFYHGFVLGLISDLRGLYIVTSNRESGYGRYDIMLEPVADGYDGIIIEFKVFDPGRETSMEDTVESALKQIEEKKYETSLIHKGITKEKIRKYGFAFKGKQVLIGK